MSLKSDKLSKRIGEIQQFLTDKVNREASYQKIQRELVKIGQSLKSSKLTLQIVSQDNTATEALKNCLTRSQVLTDTCNLKTATFPEAQPQQATNSSAILIFARQSDNNIRKGQSYFPLSNSMIVSIGRDPNRSDILIADSCTYVSGYHAEIKQLQNKDSDRNSCQWQIENFSNNGTFVNDDRIDKIQTLKKGDTINLGHRDLIEKSTQFIFEPQLNPNLESTQLDLLDCDILCLLVKFPDLLTAKEKWFLDRIAEAEISIIKLIIEIPQSDSKIIKQVKQERDRIAAWLKANYPHIEIDPISLLLQPFYPNAQVKDSQPRDKQQIDTFINSLERSLKKPDDISIKRLGACVLSQLQKIEQLLIIEKLIVEQEVKNSEKNSDDLDAADLNVRAKKALKAADKLRDKFFKAVKRELDIAQDNLLSNLSDRSLPTKIKKFTNVLEPDTSFDRGYCFVSLKVEQNRLSNTSNADETIIYLCRREAGQWINNEWQNITTLYEEGGLQKTLSTIHSTLNFIPDLNLDKSLFKIQSSNNFKSILNQEFYPEPTSTKYKQPGLIGYTFKNIRSFLMATAALIGIFAASGGVALNHSLNSELAKKNNKMQEANNNLGVIKNQIEKNDAFILDNNENFIEQQIINIRYADEEAERIKQAEEEKEKEKEEENKYIINIKRLTKDIDFENVIDESGNKEKETQVSINKINKINCESNNILFEEQQSPLKQLFGEKNKNSENLTKKDCSEVKKEQEINISNLNIEVKIPEIDRIVRELKLEQDLAKIQELDRTLKELNSKNEELKKEKDELKAMIDQLKTEGDPGFNKALIMLFLIPIACFVIPRDYQNEKSLKLEDATDKLKGDFVKQYQSFSKELIARLIQKLELILEQEEQQLKENLETVEEEYQNYIANSIKQRTEIKSISEKYKSKLKDLDKEIGELKRLKRI